MKIDILTIFPRIFDSFLDTSLIRKALDRKFLKINIHNPRDYAIGKHKSVDDKPYGGGPGMLLMIEPIYNALSDIKGKHTILLSPQGQKLTQKKVDELSKLKQITLICGRYEGFDERIRENLIDEEISIGNYVLSGGEIPAMVLIEAISRKIPGVLGSKESLDTESFKNGKLLDFPQYTRPESFRGWKVPKVLLSGNHKEIDKWRKEKMEEKAENHPF